MITWSMPLGPKVFVPDCSIVPAAPPDPTATGALALDTDDVTNNELG